MARPKKAAAERHPQLRPLGPETPAGQLTPHRMTKMHLPPEMSLAMDQIAMDIFVDIANCGHSFSKCLTAVYLSGFEHGHQLTKKMLPGSDGEGI